MHLDPRLVMAVVTVESHWDESAISVDGAIGLGQLKPGTARRLGVDAYSGKSNLRGTTLYLHRLLGIFKSSRTAIDSAIASYNAGPIAVENNGGRAPGFASKHYVAKVMATWHSLVMRLRSEGEPTLADLPDETRGINPVAAEARRQAAYWSGNASP